MNQAYIDKNVADCERRIVSLEARLKNSKASGEDALWLKKEIDGYTSTAKRLAETVPVPDPVSA